MTCTRILPAAAVLLFALAGCSSGGSDQTPVAAESSAATSAAPATTAPAAITDEQTIRYICNRVVELGNANNFDADENLKAGRQAELIDGPKFSLPGRQLVKAAGAASTAPGPDTNLDIARAQLDFLDACGDRFGDGPW